MLAKPSTQADRDTPRAPRRSAVPASLCGHSARSARLDAAPPSDATVALRRSARDRADAGAPGTRESCADSSSRPGERLIRTRVRAYHRTGSPAPPAKPASDDRKTAVEWSVIERVPCSIRLLRTPQGSASFYDFEEYERLVDAARSESQAYVAVLLGGEAGMRCGEIIDIGASGSGGARKRGQSRSSGTSRNGRHSSCRRTRSRRASATGRIWMYGSHGCRCGSAVA